MFTRWAVSGVLGLVLASHALAQPYADPARHRVGYIQHAGARLHYLEWQGEGPPVVLLPGYSLTAHAFDDIAPALAARHRVIAFTPRGFGESDALTSTAFTMQTLVHDLGALLDSLRIDRAALVGHSLSGSVAIQYALQHPNRVSQLVLLDAYPYHQAEGGDAVDARSPVSVPPFDGDTTYGAVGLYLARYRFVPFRPAMQADLRAKPLEPEASRRREMTAQYITDHRASPPDVRDLRVPSVQLCAIPTVRSEYPWLRPASAEYRSAQRYVVQHLAPFARRLCGRYARTVPQGRTISVSGSHYWFFTEPASAAAVLARTLSPGDGRRVR